jgi:membrane-associated phospholipid phosphatase
MFASSMGSFLTLSVKLFFHGGRPYLENIELADMTLGEYTSAEFGMPSGHSISSSLHPFFIFYYFTWSEYKAYWDQRSMQKILIWFLLLVYTLGVAYSRIYTGRHTLDQCISGLLLGAWTLNFYWYLIKPHVYDPS